MTSKIFLSCAVVGIALANTAAQASVTSGGSAFAKFSTLPGNHIVWENDIYAGGTGTGGSLHGSLSNVFPSTWDVIQVKFSYVGSAPAAWKAAYTNQTVYFAFNGTAASGNPATHVGGNVFQDGLDGAFEFFLGSQQLLSGYFTGGRISGVQGLYKAKFTANNIGTHTSTFVDVPFSSGNGPGTFVMKKSNLNVGGVPSPLFGPTGMALNSFDPPAEGTFYFGTGGSVPEPTSWAMMIAGFAMTGAVLRQRTRRRASAFWAA